MFQNNLSLSNIPVALAGGPYWVTYVHDDGHKVPFNPCTGKSASIDDASTWSSVQDALFAYRSKSTKDGRRYHGIGRVVLPQMKTIGADLDRAVDASGDLVPSALDIVTHLDSFTELSPSGNGLHTWVKGTLPNHGRKFALRDGLGVQFFDTGYLTFTGNHLATMPAKVYRRQRELEMLYRRLLRDGASSSTLAVDEDHVPAWLQTPLPEGRGLSDDEIIERCMSDAGGETFRRRWYADISADDYPTAKAWKPDYSLCDYGVCLHLAWYTPDVDQIVRIFERSPLHDLVIPRGKINRPKKWLRHVRPNYAWDRYELDRPIWTTYGERTALTALANLRKHWTPGRRTTPKIAPEQIVLDAVPWSPEWININELIHRLKGLVGESRVRSHLRALDRVGLFVVQPGGPSRPTQYSRIA
jgi:hypothetical protein